MMMTHKKFTTLASAISVLLMTNACSLVGPDYSEPKTALQKDWVSSKNAGESPHCKVCTQRNPQLATWWKIFNDPVLDKIITEARSQNLSLQAAGLRIFEARAQLGIAAGNEYPQVQKARGNLTQQQLSSFNSNSSPGMDRVFAATGIGLDVGWELDVWGLLRRGVEASQANLDGFIANYDDVLVSLTAEVARVYTLIRTNEVLIQVAKDNVKIQERTVEIARTLFKGGAINEMDYLQAETLLNNTRASIPPIENQLRQSKNALSVLLGKAVGSNDVYLSQSKPIPVAPLQVAIGVPAEMLRRRPDIRLAERQLAAQSALIGVAEAELYPHFSLLGSINLSASDAAVTYASLGGSSLGRLFDSRSFQYSIGPSVSWNIFNYGRIKNQVRVEDARFQALVAAYQNTVLNASKEAENALSGFVNAQKQREELQKSYDAAKRSVDLSLYQYQEGLVDYQRVLDSQRTLYSTQDALTRSNSDITVNLINLYKALGGGWETRTEQDFVPEAVKKQMRERTDWGDLMKAGKLIMPEQDKSQKWRLPNW
jgi:NodT family efflux transporter outer membrane factor (OMF) lipoprotein